MKLILCSKRDPASYHIFKLLTENYGFKEKESYYVKEEFKLIIVDEDLVHYKLKDNNNINLLIYASKHASEKKIPCLTVHSDGNWGKAMLGGEDYTISFAPALCIKQALLELYEFRNEDGLDKYQVTLEVTHHGPNNQVPSIWVEVGSSEEEWNDLKACEAVCEAILSLEKINLKDQKVIVGFGGPHYAPSFTKLILNKDYAVGHIIPKYALDDVPERLIEEAYLKTVPEPDFGVIDWEGTKKNQREKILKVFEKNGWEIRRLSEIK